MNLGSLWNLQENLRLEAKLCHLEKKMNFHSGMMKSHKAHLKTTKQSKREAHPHLAVGDSVNEACDEFWIKK